MNHEQRLAEVTPEQQMHIYERGGPTWKACRNCGTAARSNGWYWFAGHRSKTEPNCAVIYDDKLRNEWLEQAEHMPPN